MTPNGLILHEGFSRINGKPIVIIATGIGRKSENVKTGSLIQTWILLRDRNPVSGNKHRHDVAVCGQCPHRKGTCYVNLGQAPLAVYRAYKRGVYPHYNELKHAPLFKGKILRMGAYGDPAAVAPHVWGYYVPLFDKVLGYTHLAETKLGKGFAHLCMGSADTPNQAVNLQANGWRTFRVVSPSHGGLPLLKNEILCLSESRGVSCDRCKLCGGMSTPHAKSVAINAHGGYFQQLNWKGK